LAYKMRYNEDADVLMLVMAEHGKLSHAEELGDVVVHFDEDGAPLFMEILRASKVVPSMVEALAKKEIIVA
jgi:uncharacterized protein YuzE